MRPEINYGNYVLLRFDGPKPLYTIFTSEEWEAAKARNKNAWRQVARGTYAEMMALAKLMPEPKTLGFD